MKPKKWPNYIAIFARILVVSIIMIILYSYAMFQGGFISWFLFYSVLTVMVIGFLTVLLPLRALEITRSISERQLKNGDRTKVTVSMRNKGWLPLLYIGVLDIPPDGLKVESHPGAFFMLTSKPQSYSYIIKGDQRGVYHYTHLEVESGDLFGFFRKKRMFVTESDVRVYPRIAHVPQDFMEQELRINRTKVEGGHRMQSNYNETLNFANVREYVTGDRLSSIDWKITARHGKLTTKEFETEDYLGYTILFDTRVENIDAFESALEWVAGVIHTLFKERATINFATIGSTSVFTHKGNDQAHVRHIMNTLVEVSAEKENSERSPIQPSFQLLHTIVYVIPSLHEQALADMRRLVQKGYALIVLYEEQEPAPIQLKQMRVQAVQMPLTIRTNTSDSRRGRQKRRSIS